MQLVIKAQTACGIHHGGRIVNALPFLSGQSCNDGAIILPGEGFQRFQKEGRLPGCLGKVGCILKKITGQAHFRQHSYIKSRCLQTMLHLMEIFLHPALYIPLDDSQRKAASPFHESQRP